MLKNALIAGLMMLVASPALAESYAKIDVRACPTPALAKGRQVLVERKDWEAVVKFEDRHCRTAFRLGERLQVVDFVSLEPPNVERIYACVRRPGSSTCVWTSSGYIGNR